MKQETGFIEKPDKPGDADFILLPVRAARKISGAVGDDYFRSIVEVIVTDMDLALNYSFVGEVNYPAPRGGASFSAA